MRGKTLVTKSPSIHVLRNRWLKMMARVFMTSGAGLKTLMKLQFSFNIQERVALSI